ncbi:hypothetical protein GIB67_018585 [Kingdonia uniflora]|uniref:J domain-containing protein n=1 Tax=Kingdonia uniflora TaxID=39325 RepID=A0A7J7L8G7_9MAGN|nr:hypothetical protein GIB67_018585 [Kingdonia uniflora]
MGWKDWYEVEEEAVAASSEQDTDTPFDCDPLFSKPMDYYKILEVDYDAKEDTIRSNFIRLALKWHPDKRKDVESATSAFQDINEAYKVLSDPARRREYDKDRMLHIYDCNLIEHLNRYKELILTCNGLGIKHSIW